MGALILFPSKHTMFIVFQIDQQTTANLTKITCFLPDKHRLIHNQNCVNKLDLIVAPKMKDRILQTYLTTGHSNIKCLTDRSCISEIMVLFYYQYERPVKNWIPADVICVNTFSQAVTLYQPPTMITFS